MAIDPTARIADTARIDPGAAIGARTVVGEYCIIESDVTIGADCRLEPYVFVKRWTTMGDGNEISAGTVLGSDPLDKSFTGERSYLRIGDRNRIREHYTISRGTEPESVTEIGDGNYFMTCGHIAHNCRLGNDNILASCALVAGYVEIEDRVFVSGGTAIHQFTKIGRLAMLGANIRVNRDVPPYFLYSGVYVEPVGVNVVGLKRADFSPAEISVLKKSFRLLYWSGLKLDEALARIETELPSEHTQHLVAFVRARGRGICRPSRHSPGTFSTEEYAE